MSIYEYHLEADGSPDSGMRLECRVEDDNPHEEAINAAADVVCRESFQNWTLSLVERWENPQLHDCVDADGEFHFVEVAKFDKAIGIIPTDL